MTRMLWQALIAVLVAYALVLALVYLFQSRLVYFPETGRSVAATPQAYGLRFEPVTITRTMVTPAWSAVCGTDEGFCANVTRVGQKTPAMIATHRPVS